VGEAIAPFTRIICSPLNGTRSINSECHFEPDEWDLEAIKRIEKRNDISKGVSLVLQIFGIQADSPYPLDYLAEHTSLVMFLV
jgi:hypothetical protein